MLVKRKLFDWTMKFLEKLNENTKNLVEKKNRTLKIYKIYLLKYNMHNIYIEDIHYIIIWEKPIKRLHHKLDKETMFRDRELFNASKKQTTAKAK